LLKGEQGSRNKNKPDSAQDRTGQDRTGQDRKVMEEDQRIKNKEDFSRGQSIE
jgi:hypothetical protein